MAGGTYISRSGNSVQIIKTYFTIIALLISFTHTQSFLCVCVCVCIMIYTHTVYIYMYYTYRNYTNTAEVCVSASHTAAAAILYTNDLWISCYYQLKCRTHNDIYVYILYTYTNYNIIIPIIGGEKNTPSTRLTSSILYI